ncbi:MAG: TIGR04100 family radical SAM protein [Lachnospiraceae bacterium]|nr:TIGR04100 family radical SAM protein [Lachnospiraceae bacterium]
MADILYTYHNQVYANITNRCDCSCVFCIRSHKDAIGEAEHLWHEKEPSLEEIKKAIDEFDFTECTELVYCGYGEPTCAIENLIASAAYAKEKYNLKIRLNTNGLANLYHGRNVIPQLAEVVDSVSISLNAPTPERYNEVTRPSFPNAFEAMCSFAVMAKEAIRQVRFSVVDVLSQEEIEASFRLADELGVPLRVRKYA